MKHTIAIAVLAVTLAGCGTMPGGLAARTTAGAAQALAAKANPFLGLTKLEHGPGGEPVKRKTGKYHLNAKTKMGGILRVVEVEDVALTFYNYEEITVPKKVAQIADALDEAAAAAEGETAKVAKDFAAKLRAPNPYLGLTDIRFADGPPPATTFWVHAKRHVFAKTPDGGNLCLAEQRPDIAFQFGIVRNGWNVNDGRTSKFATEAFMAALPSVKDPEVKAYIEERLGSR